LTTPSNHDILLINERVKTKLVDLFDLVTADEFWGVEKPDGKPKKKIKSFPSLEAFFREAYELSP
jgi:hypothetical protein